MLPHASWPEPVHGAYRRVDVQRFLDDAERARERLEAAVDVASQRRKVLQEQLATLVERNARLTRELFDTTRDLRTDRQAQANAVAVVLATAEAEAAALLARAREEAAEIRSSWPSVPAARPLTLVPPKDDGPAPGRPPLLVS